MLLWVGPLSLTFFRKLFDESLRSRLLQSLFLSFFHGTLDICLCFLTKLYISPAQIPVLSTTMHLKMNGVFQPNSIQQWFRKGNSKYLDQQTSSRSCLYVSTLGKDFFKNEKCCQLNEKQLVTAHTSKNMIRGTWLDVSFFLTRGKSAIWLAVGFLLDQNQINFVPYQWVHLSAYMYIIYIYIYIASEGRNSTVCSWI